MGVTLKDLFEHVRGNKAKLVVWRQITAFLSKEFVSSDASNAKNTLQLDEGGAVPEEVIEEVIDVIYMNHIAPTEKRIVNLMDTELDSRLDQLRAQKEETRQLDKSEEAPEAAPIKKKKAK